MYMYVCILISSKTIYLNEKEATSKTFAGASYSLPCLINDLLSMGANEGSNSSCTFCSKTGVPNWIEFSSVRKKSGCCKSIILRF